MRSSALISTRLSGGATKKSALNSNELKFESPDEIMFHVMEVKYAVVMLSHYSIVKELITLLSVLSNDVLTGLWPVLSLEKSGSTSSIRDGFAITYARVMGFGDRDIDNIGDDR